jgi:hypothetical protein
MLDEFLGQGSGLGGPYLEVHDLAGVDVQHDVQLVVDAAGGSFQFRDVPRPDFAGSPGPEFGFLLRRVAGLGAAFAGLAGFAQEPVHGGL